MRFVLDSKIVEIERREGKKKNYWFACMNDLENVCNYFFPSFFFPM